MVQTVTTSRIRVRTPGMESQTLGEHPVHDRQSILKDWDQDALNESKIVCIGAGGLGGKYLQNLARMGIGHIVVCDSDIVELSNLNRQFFYKSQLYQNKAYALLRNLEIECTSQTILEAYPDDFQEVIEDRTIPDIDLIACLVDNNQTRHDVCRYAYKRGIPVIFAGVSRTALNGYVFIQKDACFNCIHPDNDDDTQQCREPSVVYIHTAVIGICVYTTAALLMDWEIAWNHYRLFLDSDSIASMQPKRNSCEVCSWQP